MQSVADPQMTGIAGYGSMQIYMPRRGVHEVLEFHARSPRATRADMWADKVLGEAPDGFSFIVERQVNEIGYQSIGSLGNLRAIRRPCPTTARWTSPTSMRRPSPMPATAS